MPPMIEDKNYGEPRAPIRQPPPTRGGLAPAGANRTQPTYRSPYVGPPQGNSAPAQRPFSALSNSGIVYGRVEPRYDTSINPNAHLEAPLPPAPFRVQVPSYQPNGVSSEHPRPQAQPYLFQRSAEFQARRSAQSALGSSSQSMGRGSYPLQVPGQQQYHTPYNAPRTVPSSGHGHDIPRQQQLQYRPPPAPIPIYRPQPTSYSSPYHPQNTSQNTSQNLGPARQPQRSQAYSQNPIQVAIPSYRPQPAPPRPRPTQHRPAPYQPTFPTMESSIYPSTSPSPSSTPGPSSGSKKRIGRPPGSKNKSSKLAMVEIPSSSPTQAHRGRTSKGGDSSAPPSTIPKKRGRPYATAESAQKAKEKAERKANPDAYPKKRGRPFKITHQVDIAIPEAKYVPFLCEWKGCQAELHNLETLRLHITAVHGKKNAQGVRVCKWGKCGNSHIKIEDVEVGEDSKAPEQIGRKVEFKSRKEWKEHIEQKHLIPFAWHMGDGPKATYLDLEPPPAVPHWLCDSTGTQVTPSVSTQTLEGGFAKINNARRWAKEQRKLKIDISEKSTGQYMKTQAQIVQEENADAEGEGASGEIETGTSTGDDENEGTGRDDNGEEGGDENENDMEMSGEVENEGQGTREGTGEDSGADLMILDRL